jgi:hypothetical protein
MFSTNLLGSLENKKSALKLVESWLSQGSLTEGGRINTVDLLVLISIDKLLLKRQTLLTFLPKQATLRKRTVLSLPLL